MASANSRQVGAAFLAAALTAGLVYFGTGLHPWWPLMWFAPLPVLLFAMRSSWWGAGLTALIAWIGGGLNLWYYFNSELHMPAGVQAVIFLTPALLFAASVLLLRGLLRRGAPWSAILAFPATWTTFEYLMNLISPHGTGGSLAYSQLNFLAFLQLASVTGPWGLTFFLLLFPASVAIALHARTTAPKQALQVLVTAAGAMAVVLIFGVVRLSLPAPKQQVRVGLIASDASGNTGVADPGPATHRLLHDYSVQAEALAAQGARVIVMPEKLAVVTDSDINQTAALLQSLSDRTQSTIVVGVVDVSPPVQYNRALVYRPGASVLTYDKQHMLPPFESRFKRGTTLTTLGEPSGVWGVAICKDMDFTQLSRQYGDTGSGLMLVPAWDFVIDRLEHGHMSIMRGVESGFSIARAAKQGYLTITDNRGRIRAEIQSDSSPFASLVADVPTGHDTTVYLLMGDWFAWVVILIFVLTCAQLYRLRKDRKVPQTPAPPIMSAA
jgi:apolipoprotein N-acyltransferase